MASSSEFCTADNPSYFQTPPSSPSRPQSLENNNSGIQTSEYTNSGVQTPENTSAGFQTPENTNSDFQTPGNSSSSFRTPADTNSSFQTLPDPNSGFGMPPNSSSPSNSPLSDCPVGIIEFKRRSFSMKKLFEFLFIGSPEAAFHEERRQRASKSVSSSPNGKQLSSIEVDPDAESDGDSMKSIVAGVSCFTMKRYAFLIAVAELLGLLYLTTTSLVIYTKGLMRSWFFQPFLAPLWLLHPTLIFSLMCIFCLVGFACVLCLMQALSDGYRWRRLIIPHVVLQIVTIFFTSIFSVIAVVLLIIRGTFTLRILDLAGSTLGNGVAGIGNIVLGLEYGRTVTASTGKVLAHAGAWENITSNGQFTSSVVQRNMIGAIWESFSYEIALAVALIVFATICAVEMYAWMLLRQIYAQQIIKAQKGMIESNEMIHNRRRYHSTGEVTEATMTERRVTEDAM